MAATDEPRKKMLKTDPAAATTAAAAASGAGQGAAAAASGAGSSPAATAAASGAVASQGLDSPPTPMSQMLETGFNELLSKGGLSEWARETKTYADRTLLKFLKDNAAKVSFPVPSEVLLIAPLEIKAAASGANLTSFCEVMNYENLVWSFSQSSQYEAAGTVFMCDCIGEPDLDPVRPFQLENASRLWSEEAYKLSASKDECRRYTFDIPIPVKVFDPKVAQKKDKESSAVVMAHALPVLAGRAVVITWYGAMAEALQKDDEAMVFKLFDAALSVPIRLRLCPDGDVSCLAGLQFSEAMFATSAAAGAVAFWNFAGKARMLGDVGAALKDNSPLAKIKAAMRKYGLTFKGKAVSDAHVKALRALDPFLGDEKCNEAYDVTESVCPELVDPTILMRIAQLSSGRVSPADSFVFALDCLRVFRLAGTHQEGDYTVSLVTGQEKKTACAGALLIQEGGPRRVHRARA